MIKRKLLAAGLVATMMISIVGCGGQDAKEKTTKNNDEQTNIMEEVTSDEVTDTDTTSETESVEETETTDITTESGEETTTVVKDTTAETTTEKKTFQEKTTKKPSTTKQTGVFNNKYKIKAIDLFYFYMLKSVEIKKTKALIMHSSCLITLKESRVTG